MSRSLPVWLLASALAAVVGCGGGAETDSGAVASNSDAAAPTTGETTMPTGGDMVAPEGGMSGSADPADMNADMNDDMYGSGGAADDPSADMTADMYGDLDEAGGGDSADADTAAMAASYATAEDGFPDDGDTGADDTAAMAASYAGGADGTPGASPEDMEAQYAAGGGDPGAEGFYSGGEGGLGGGAVEEKVPEGFDGKAELAFRRGKGKDAMQFLYAHALTTDAGAESLLPTIRWVGGLVQPKLAVRWGAGFVVTKPRNYNGDPKPVGSQQKIPTRAGNQGDTGGVDDLFGGGGASDYGAGEEVGGGGGNNSLLSKGAGELGDKLAAAYTERVMRGDFGEVLKQAMESSSGGRGGNDESDMGSGYGGADPGGADPGSYGAKAGAESGGGAAAALTEVTQIMPGLSMLGIGTQKELIERARENDIDVLVVIDVKLQFNTKTGLVTNDSALSLLDVKTQKKFHTTRKFNNITIQKARAAGKEDGVDNELGKLFEAIDTNFKMIDLPAGLNAKVADNRIAGLAAKAHDNPLPILVEARMYHTKGLLEESALFAAYEQILGVDHGRMLATGTEEDKKKVLGRWLPEL